MYSDRELLRKPSIWQIEELWKAVHSELEKIANRTGITWGEYRLLCGLPPPGMKFWLGKSPKELANQLGRQPSQVSALLMSCEKKGLIFRGKQEPPFPKWMHIQEPVDGRLNHIRLNLDGWNAVRAFRAELDKFELEELPRLVASIGFQAQKGEAPEQPQKK